MTNYKKVIAEIVSRRKNDLLAYEYKLINAMRQNDELHKTDVAIRTIKHDKRQGKPIDESLLAQLTKKRYEMLNALGLSENPPFRCAICSDTGIAEGKPCACVIAATTASHAFEASFEDSDLGVFDKSDLPRTKNVYSAMLSFCEKFPDTNSKNIILSGGTGTGKTYLASCVANRLSQNGYSVLFLSAFAFVNRMLNYHTAPTYEKLDYLSPVIDCDLLIIDDLGTESILKNVTIEYLYSVLNERIRLKRHNMITTNFDSNMILSRYGERVFSRLFDKRISAGFILAEKDIRKL